MRNLAAVIQRWHKLLGEGFSTASDYTANITNTFIVRGAEGTSASSVLGILGGALTTAGALFSPAAMPVNTIAGLLGFTNGMIDAMNPALIQDIRFDEFAEIQAVLGGMGIASGKVLSDFFEQLFFSTPPKGDVARGLQLAHILETGSFASQDVGTGDGDLVKADMIRMVQASIIGEAWKMSRVAIVKWSKAGKFVDITGFNPCGGAGAQAFGMESHLACEFDRNYMIVSGPGLI